MTVTRARAARRLLSAVLTAAAALAVVLGTQFGLPHADASEFHGPHALQASSIAANASFSADEFAPSATIEHSHLSPEDECYSAPSGALISAAVFREGMDRTAFGVAATIFLAVAVLAAWTALGATRGPPGALAGRLAGRSLLIRFCIARR